MVVIPFLESGPWWQHSEKKLVDNARGHINEKKQRGSNG
jgi:hypothetical protein